MQNDAIKEIIAVHFPTAEIIVTSDDHVHFQIQIAASEFTQKSLIQQHQMVMKILQPFILDGAIHAVALKTRIL